MTDEKLEQAKYFKKSIKDLNTLVQVYKEKKEIYLQGFGTSKIYAFSGETTEKIINLLGKQLTEWQKEFEAI